MVKNMGFAQSRKTALIFCALASLAGCAAKPPAPLVETQVKYVHWDWPPDLQSCAPDAPLLTTPHIAASDPHAGSKVAAYIEQLRAHDGAERAAAADCRTVLSLAVQAWKGAQ